MWICCLSVTESEPFLKMPPAGSSGWFLLSLWFVPSKFYDRQMIRGKWFTVNQTLWSMRYESSDICINFIISSLFKQVWFLISLFYSKIKKFRTVLDWFQCWYWEWSLYKWLLWSNKCIKSTCIYSIDNHKWRNIISELYWETTR